MKKYLFALLAFLFTAAAPLQAAQTLYEDAKNGVSLSYPHNWIKREQHAGALVTFLTPKEGNRDKFSDNVNLMVQPLPDPKMTLEQYTDFSVNQLKDMVKDFQRLELNNTSLDNIPAKEIIYTGRDREGKIMKYRQIWAIRDAKAYLLSYAAEKDSFEEYKPDAEVIIDSFEFNS